MFECLRRVILCGGIVLVQNSGQYATTVRAAVGTVLSFVFVFTTREYNAYREASSNALAYAARSVGEWRSAMCRP